MPKLNEPQRLDHPWKTRQMKQKDQPKKPKPSWVCPSCGNDDCMFGDCVEE